ncbi:MAG: hypothetical protein IKP47_01500 [Ruminococcus sp.]|nr:hypothetical protein [Ruminococcus sp.]
MDSKQDKIGFLPVCPFEHETPELQLEYTERDERLDVITDCEYTENTEARD